MTASTPARRLWSPGRLPHRRDGLLAASLAGGTVAAAVLYTHVNRGSRALDLTGALLIVALAGVVALRGWPLPALATGVAVVVPYHLLRFPPEVVLPALLLLRYSVAVTGSRLRAAVSGALTVVAVLLSMRLSAGGWPGGDAVDAVGWLAAAAALGQAVRHQRAHSAVLTEREPVDHQARGAGPRAAGDRSL